MCNFAPRWDKPSPTQRQYASRLLHHQDGAVQSRTKPTRPGQKGQNQPLHGHKGRERWKYQPKEQQGHTRCARPQIDDTMHKYISIMDISKYSSYKSVNARLLYLHVACHVDTSTYTCVKSTRQLAGELGLSHAQVRHALQQLIDDGLLTTQVAAHHATHYATHFTTQQVTHLHVVRINELEDINNTASDRASDTASNTASNTENRTQIKEQSHESADTHTLRARRADLETLLCENLGLTPAVAIKAVEAFAKRQEIKGKTWESLGDMKAHLLAWTEKRTGKPKRITATDDDDREAEKRRTREQLEKESEIDKLKDQAAQMKRSQAEFWEEWDEVCRQSWTDSYNELVARYKQLTA